MTASEKTSKETSDNWNGWFNHSIVIKQKKVKGNWFSALKMKRKRKKEKEKSRPTVTEAHELLPFLWFVIQYFFFGCNTVLFMSACFILKRK